MSKVNIVVGRQRGGGNISPFAAGYLRNIQAQTAQMKRNMHAIIAGVKDATPKAIEHALKPVYAESQRLVPVDTGELKSSGILAIVQKGDHPVVELGYGKGGNPEYAAHVHERVDISHASPTQAKFVEQPVLEQMPLLAGRIKRYIEEDTGLRGEGNG